MSADEWPALLERFKRYQAVPLVGENPHLKGKTTTAERKKVPTLSSHNAPREEWDRVWAWMIQGIGEDYIPPPRKPKPGPHRMMEREERMLAELEALYRKNHPLAA